MGPKIYVCGDPHGEFQHLVDIVHTHRPHTLILLGDMSCKRPLHEEMAVLDELDVLTELYWIPGNHDSDNETVYDNLFGSRLADRNLHGRIVDVCGFKVAGLGGVFRTKVWDPAEPSVAGPDDYLTTMGKGNRWRGGLPLKHRTTIFGGEVSRFLKGNLRADVLVTHEAPAANPSGFQVIGDVADALRVSAAFHGHHHKDIDYAGTVWYGVGLRGVMSLGGEVVVPGIYG